MSLSRIICALNAGERQLQDRPGGPGSPPLSRGGHVEFQVPTPHISKPKLEGMLMARDVARDWMWSEACEMLARAERMHRELFRPGVQARQPAWEPPVDMLETEFEVLVLVALPGVD